jgi:hypothetical protein
MCRQYRRWCVDGQKNRVPQAWKIDYWGDYINDPWDCNHADFNEYMDGSAQCKFCGKVREGSADCRHYQFSRQSDGTATCDSCGVTPEWSK